MLSAVTYSTYFNKSSCYERNKREIQSKIHCLRPEKEIADVVHIQLLKRNTKKKFNISTELRT